MPAISPLLWCSLRVHQVFGANTDVGKTVLSSILCRASSKVWPQEPTAYLKPVSTGPDNEADHRFQKNCVLPSKVGRWKLNTFVASHIGKYTTGVSHKTLFQYDQAVSPHIAAKGKKPPSDEELLGTIYYHASQRVTTGFGWLFIETAGGVHSPGPSGSTQADLYRPLRSPVVLIGDSKLGGISLTVSAYESLRIRGYDIESVLMFQDAEYGNAEYLTEYFDRQHGVTVTAVPQPPPRIPENDEEAMLEYYDQTSHSSPVREVLEHLDDRHRTRVQALESMASEAHEKIWYPFTQQKLLKPDDIVAMDSALGSYLQTLKPKSQAPVNSSEPLLQPSFDGSASWWTQGLGHANLSLTMAAAYAAGRYGHVMFAGAIHEPALTLAKMLLEGLQNPRLSRVFFSDNGSTGMEVAVKMALRAARVRYGWSPDTKVEIVGLSGAYHGDTMGVMDCAEPNIYNEKVEWYEGKGVWLSYPTVQCIKGRWRIRVPDTMDSGSGEDREFRYLHDVFDLESRRARGDHRPYERYILNTLRDEVRKGRKFGALVIEPVVLGAGGMLLVDPLFQQTLTKVVRETPNLFGPDTQPHNRDEKSWTGLPVVFDEVFTGLYRLGRFAASSFLGVYPDISVHAKLLTGGLIPLCTTLASESIFQAFASDDKSDALLHGHSYTAHPIGCQVAVESLKQMLQMEKRGDWEWAIQMGKAQAGGDTGRTQAGSHVWSIWPPDVVEWISQQDGRIGGVWALGSVLAVRMRARDGGGYKSTAAEGVRDRLLQGTGGNDGRRWNVHSRVLGDVLYLMGSHKTTEDEVAEVADLLCKALQH